MYAIPWITFCIHYGRKYFITILNMCRILVLFASLCFEVQEGIQSFWIGKYKSTARNNCVLTILINLILTFQHIDQHFKARVQTEPHSTFVCLAPFYFFFYSFLGDHDVFQVFSYKYIGTWQLRASGWMYVTLVQFPYATFCIVHFPRANRQLHIIIFELNVLLSVKR
jgi:phosphatidylglycerophosphate synthase